MQNFRNFLVIIAICAAALGGVYLLNLINSNNSINTSSASVYNIIGLSQVEDEVTYSNKIVIDVNVQILLTDTVNTGNLEIGYDKNLLEVEDIIMPSNIIAINQKIDSAEGKIILEINSINSQGLQDVSNLARIVFTKKQELGKFTNIMLLSPSTLGNPNTLDSSEKSISISF